jgi:hypothetical protein
VVTIGGKMTATSKTNLKILKPSRQAPKEGDVFVMLPPDGKYLFGRVISTRAKAGPSMPNAILIYIFRTRSKEKNPPSPADLVPSNLLLPPVMTNRLPWSRGYFESLSTEPIAAGQALPRHCFRSMGGAYYDESSRILARPLDPCGDWGLHSYRTIDDQVSDSLGIARVPDDGD